MKVLVASFQCESNSFGATHPQIGDFEYFKGEDIFKKLVVKDELLKNDITVIPSIYANALPSGTVTQKIYNLYKNQIIEDISNNSNVDGIFIYVHGSMEVDGIGSGELQLLKEIRKIVNKDCLIALSMDLHANISEDLGNYADIICTYKTAPHTDQNETQMRAIKILINCLNNKIKPYTYVVKIPMIIKGDTMLTRLNPLKALEELTQNLEKLPNIFAVNLFFAHCWIDSPNTSASVVVTGIDREKSQEIAKMLANKFYSTRKDYKFTIEADSGEKCVDLSLDGAERRIFITDSGDNTTAGAEGDNLDLSKLFLKKDVKKRVCIAGITQPDIINKFWQEKDGAKIKLDILDKKEFTILKHGEILGWAKEIIGKALTVRNGNIDIVFTEKRSAFIEKGNFDKAKVDLLEYRIVVVKLGYLFEELKPYADRELFALTSGTSCVEVEKLALKNIKRPMYPLDKELDWQC